jgi:uncharacterized membrane protein YecN with MAPEG domain
MQAMTLIDETRRTCEVHGRFRGPPLVTDTDPSAIAIGGRGKLICHAKGLTVEGQHVSEAGPATVYGILVVMMGAWLWWLYAERDVAIDAEGLGPLLVGFTLTVGAVLRQWSTGEPLRLEIPWRSVGLFWVRGRKIRITVQGFEPAGELCFVASDDPEAILTKWRPEGIVRI